MEKKSGKINQFNIFGAYVQFALTIVVVVFGILSGRIRHFGYLLYRVLSRRLIYHARQAADIFLL